MKPAAILVVAVLIWAIAARLAWPREIWDVPGFWWAWGAATLLAGAGGWMLGGPVVVAALVFGPLVAVLAVGAVLSGGGIGLWPLALAAAAVLALPGLGLAAVAARR
jgi:hypothetical protein